MALKDQLGKVDNKYTSPGARRIIEDHLNILRTTSKLMDIDGVRSTKYRTNLYGLYQSLGIPKSLWWVTTRVNNFSYRTDIFSLRYLAVPDGKRVEELVRINNTKTVPLF
jgi:hypothetical protein